MQPKEWADQQRAVLERHATWVADEGGMELPVLLDTYLKPPQRLRIRWLKTRAVGQILDVGCSWGYVLARMGGHAGVDINPHLLDMARLLAPQRTFECADARSLPFADKSYDTVVLAEILEHLPWIEGVRWAVGEAMRVARQKVLVTVPFPSSDEAVSFKHQWLCGLEEQASLKRMLGDHAQEGYLDGFVCFSSTLS